MANTKLNLEVYRRRRDAMLLAIARHLPPDVYMTPPRRGLFIWLRLPKYLSAVKLLPLAAEEGVAYAPGSRFFANPLEGENYLRLNFATQTPEAIEEGIRRLGSALKRLEVAS